MKDELGIVLCLIVLFLGLCVAYSDFKTIDETLNTK